MNPKSSSRQDDFVDDLLRHDVRYDVTSLLVVGNTYIKMMANIESDFK